LTFIRLDVHLGSRVEFRQRSRCHRSGPGQRSAPDLTYGKRVPVGDVVTPRAPSSRRSWDGRSLSSAESSPSSLPVWISRPANRSACAHSARSWPQRWRRGQRGVRARAAPHRRHAPGARWRARPRPGRDTLAHADVKTKRRDARSDLEQRRAALEDLADW